MLALLVVVLCPLLPSFTVCSPGVAAPTDASAVQRLYGEAAAGSSDLHRYLGVVEKACLSEARSTAVCLSCEALSAAAAAVDHGVNAFVCCKWEALYAQCQPIVEGLGIVEQRRRLPIRSERSGYLGKRYRNRFLGKRSGLEAELQNDDDLDSYKEPEKDFSLYLEKRARAASGAGGRRPNNFLGKRRNTFLGKRSGNVLRQVRWDLEDNGRGKGNFEEFPGNEAWKK